MKPYLVSLRDGDDVAHPAVIGEVRLDDRITLARKLGLDAATLDDRELLLHAWRRWRTECVNHLFGDFAFVITDREWFCARDRFGVRPLYYARAGETLLVSNSLEAILAQRGVDADALDERAIADYVDNGIPSDAAATIYANIRRLPPAHTLTRQHGAQRYWSLQPRAVREDAPAQLEAALQQAVSDRMTASSAVVFMSGGLDSTALAAIARERHPHAHILAATSVYRSRIGDVEETFAAEAARSIGIPIRFFALDEWSPLHALATGQWTAEPGPLLMVSMTRAIYSEVAKHAPIAMHGHPADAVLSADLQLALRPLIHARNFGALAAALVRYTRVKRRMPWFFLRELWQRKSEVAHPLESSMWPSLFEWAHPLQTGAPIELVYPWCDLRVIDAAMALDPFPWLVDKHVLRELLRGRVSETIRTRPKTFVQGGDPWTVSLSADERLDVDAASAYIDVDAFQKTVRESKQLSDATLRTVALAHWLRERPHEIQRLRA